MRKASAFLILLPAFLATACASEPQSFDQPSSVNVSESAEGNAISVVRAHRGSRDDPSEYLYDIEQVAEGWCVTVSLVDHVESDGSFVMVRGGFTRYIVSVDGHIQRIERGL